jgi:Spy/CpxP family protein refolding chaperone
MRRFTFLMVIPVLLILLSAIPSGAQITSPLHNEPSVKKEGYRAFWQSSSLGLSEAQMKALESLQNTYVAEAMPLWRELMPLKLELRYLVRDPNIQSNILLDRQKKISELQARLDNLSLSYQIKARSILTKEQLEQLSQDCLLGIESGFAMDAGTRRGVWKGFPR